jgi:hypothetical protein
MKDRELVMIKRLSPILLFVVLIACQPKDGAKHTDQGGTAPQKPASADAGAMGGASVDTAAYIRQHMTVKDARIGEGRQSTDGTPAIRALYGLVVNDGGRDVKQVSIQAELLDADGKPVAAAEYVPVMATRDGKVDAAGLLKGHSERSFGYSIEQIAPKGWTGTVRVTVTHIELHG